MLKDYLSEPLETYPNIPNIKITTPKPRYNTTSGWARDYLKNVVSDTDEWTYTEASDYKEFLTSIQDSDFRPIVQPTPFAAPRNEGDVACVFW